MNAALRQALSPARCPSGGLRVLIEGEPCVLRRSGALWVPNHRTLIAADLHLEKGSAFAARGQMLPPYDSRATLDRLVAESEALSPAAVVLLGDSFHDATSVGRMATDDRARLDRLAPPPGIGLPCPTLLAQTARVARRRAPPAVRQRQGRVTGLLSASAAPHGNGSHPPTPATSPFFPDTLRWYGVFFWGIGYGPKRSADFQSALVVCRS